MELLLPGLPVVDLQRELTSALESLYINDDAITGYFQMTDADYRQSMQQLDEMGIDCQEDIDVNTEELERLELLELGMIEDV